MILSLHPRLKARLKQLYILSIETWPNERVEIERLINALIAAQPSEKVQERNKPYILGGSVAMLGPTYKGKKHRTNIPYTPMMLEMNGTDTEPLTEWFILDPKD